MRVSTNFQIGAKPAFGTNKGFLKAANLLKEELDSVYVEDLAAHAKSVVKDEKFMAEVNSILEDNNTITGLKKLIKRYLHLD